MKNVSLILMMFLLLCTTACQPAGDNSVIADPEGSLEIEGSGN